MYSSNSVYSNIVDVEENKSFSKDSSSWKSKSSSKYIRLIDETPYEYDRKLYKQNQSLWKTYFDNYEDKFCDQNKSKSEKNASFLTDKKTHTSEKTESRSYTIIKKCPCNCTIDRTKSSWLKFFHRIG